MMKIAYTATMGFVLGLAGLPATASEQSIMCDRVLAAEDLAGTYQLEFSDTEIHLGAYVHHEANAGTVPVKIWSMGRDVVLSGVPHHENITLNFTGMDEPDWRWSDDTSFATITSEELELVLDCDIADLPRLSGTWKGRSADGYPMDFTVRLVVYQEGHLYGQWRFEAQTERGNPVGLSSVHLTPTE